MEQQQNRQPRTGRLFKLIGQQLLPNVGTLLLVGLFLWAQQAGAFPFAQGRPQGSAPNAIPEWITYQGKLTDTAGVPITGNLGMVFAIYAVPTGGTALWSESYSGASTVPVQNGEFTVHLGSVTPLPADIWENDHLYVGVRVGTDGEMTPREEISAVPRAMLAMTVPDGSITTAKIADDAVTSIQVARGTTAASNTGGTADMPDMTVTLTTGDNPVEIIFDCGYMLSPIDSAYGEFSLVVDGVVKVRRAKGIDGVAVGGDRPGLHVTMYWIGNLGAGSHTIKVRWLPWPTSATISNDPASLYQPRLLVVKELKK